LPDPDADFAEKAENIILFIGDGMGEGPRTAARWVKVGPEGLLAMDAMSASGWSRTLNASGETTDSAAGATAIATGYKTDNGMVGMDPAGNDLTTILETARAQGKAVGLVTTTQITDATPAAFAASAAQRSDSDLIALQLLDAGIDLLLGGGENRFLPPTETGVHPDPGVRGDARNLIAEATANGYLHLADAAGLALIDPAARPRLLGLFADELMARPASPTLAAMTQKAIDILAQDPDGFFLMVEGGLIDKAGHAHDAVSVIADTIALDEAVAVGQSFALTEPETLIIVTADHDTGGMELSTVSGDEGPFLTAQGTPFYVTWSADGHTTRDVPLTAQGPSSDAFHGTFENTFIHRVMAATLE